MNKEEAVKSFEKEMQDISSEYKKEIIKFFIKNREKCETELKEFIIDFLNELRKISKETAYIIMWPLRSSLLEDKLVYELNSYGEELYFEESLLSMRYQCSWLYEFIASYIEDGKKAGKKYMNWIGRGEIERAVQKNFKEFNELFVEIYIDAFRGFNKWEIYRELPKKEEIRVFIAEYMDIPQEIEA